MTAAHKVIMDVEAEIVDLKRRMTTLENEVRTNHEFSVKLFSYVREIRDDIAILRSHAVVADKRIERLEERMDRVEGHLSALRADFKELRSDFSGLRSEVSGLRSEFETFRKELPAMIADTMREVLREFRSR
jgi:chromosome segregation ATPase